MKRRKFLYTVAGGASLAVPPALAAPKGGIIELRTIRLRNSPDQQMQRTSAVVEKVVIPGLKRAGVGPVGVFANLVGPGSPCLVAVVPYRSLADMEAVSVKLTEDKEYQKGAQEYHAQPGLGYVRQEISLLRCFDSVPGIEAPPVEGRKSPRVYELRIYESNNSATLRAKIAMFESGEIGIFRRLGINPVFFGAAIAGANMPNLAYMVAFDSLAHREKAWQAFGSDPEWQKMRVKPGWSDAEIVSNISNFLLRPLAFSDLR